MCRLPFSKTPQMNVKIKVELFTVVYIASDKCVMERFENTMSPAVIAPIGKSTKMCVDQERVVIASPLQCLPQAQNWLRSIFTKMWTAVIVSG